MKKSIIIATLISFTVFFSYQYWDRPGDDEVRQAQSWLKKKFGYEKTIDELRETYNLNINYPIMTKEVVNIEEGAFKNLQYLKNVRNLHMSSLIINGENFKYLTKLPSIKTMLIYNTKITDEDFKFICDMKNLESIQILNNDILYNSLSNKGFQHIKKLVKLRKLMLYNTVIAEIDIENLKYLNELYTIEINLPQISADKLYYIFNLKKLTSLTIRNAMIYDKKILTVPEKSKLTNLTMINCNVDDDFLKYISNFTSIEYLDLNNSIWLYRHFGINNGDKYELFKNKISDEGLKYLGSLKNLTHLNINKTKVTAKGIKPLVKLRKLKKLTISDSPIDDTAIPYFLQMKNLEYLMISRTKITKEGSEKLKEKIKAVNWN